MEGTVIIGVCLHIPSTEGAVKCKQTSCETQWVGAFDMADESQQLTLGSHHRYHIGCIGEPQLPRNWVCEACEASGPLQGGKQACR